jgi:hypothetical protein
MFAEGAKLENPEKNPRSKGEKPSKQGRESTTNSTHMKYIICNVAK